MLTCKYCCCWSCYFISGVTFNVTVVVFEDDAVAVVVDADVDIRVVTASVDITLIITR